MLKFLKKYDKLISIGVFIASILLSIGVFLIPLDAGELQAYGYGGVFIITLLGAMTLFLPGPTMVATFVVGFMLNPLLVALVAGLGSALGESTGYATGYASLAIVSPKETKSTWYQKIFHWMQTHPFLTIFVLDAIPNPLTDIAGLIAGRNQYSYPKFLIASFLGKTIRFALSSFLGSHFSSLLHGK
jgi:membrane protein YqaA with SNARE-associated domain